LIPASLSALPLSKRACGASTIFSVGAKPVLRTGFAPTEKTGASAAGASTQSAGEATIAMGIKHYLKASMQQNLNKFPDD
jgi:hypothetical protein